MRASGRARSMSCAACATSPPTSALACWCTARRPSASSSPAKEAEGRKHGAACFAAVADAAAKAGVTYCIEPLAAPEANFVNTVEEAAEIARAIAHPAVRTMIDCSAAARAEAQAIPDLLRAMAADGPHRPHPPQRSQSPRPRRGRAGLRADPAGPRGRRLSRHGSRRALRLRARRAGLRRARHRLPSRPDGEVVARLGALRRLAPE